MARVQRLPFPAHSTVPASGVGPLRRLQVAAASIASFLAPGVPAAHVIVLAGDGRKIIETIVPEGVSIDPEGGSLADDPSGWEISGQRVKFEGRPVKVSGSRVGLLQMLVDADGPLRSADLAATGWAPHNAATGEENIRRHMAMLRKEITASIPGVDFDPIQADGQGYALKLR